MFADLVSQIRGAAFSKSHRLSRLPILSYYISRLVVNPPMRRFIVAILGAWIGKNSVKHERKGRLLEMLNEDGIVQLNQSLSDSQCDEIVGYLSSKLVHNRDGTVKQTISDVRPNEISLWFHTVNDVLDCPHIMEFVSSTEVVQLSTEYLGCTPTLSGIVVQWSFPTNIPSVVQKFHRDTEDWKFLRYFVYLSDVDEGCGPHVFIKGSHLDKSPLRLKIYTDEEISQKYQPERFLTVYGRRGTSIAADTSGIHKGETPTASPRMVLCFTYSILANPFLRYEPIYTRHAEKIKTYSNRLFLRKGM